MSSNKDKWGPLFWNFIHIITMHYPNNPSNKDKTNITQLIELFELIIPCGGCKIHFKLNYEKMPITKYDLESRNNIIKWGINFHNSINKYLGKKELNYDKALIIIKKINFENLYIEYFNNILDYVIFLIPENSGGLILKKKQIILFINCVIHFYNKKNKKYKLEFKNRTTFRLMKEKLIYDMINT
jgi:hypothetical protein